MCFPRCLLFFALRRSNLICAEDPLCGAPRLGQILGLGVRVWLAGSMDHQGLREAGKQNIIALQKPVWARRFVPPLHILFVRCSGDCLDIKD